MITEDQQHTITQDQTSPNFSVAAEAGEEALATQTRVVVERLSCLTLAIYPTARKLALFTDDDGDGPPKLMVMYVLDEDGDDLTDECNCELYDSSNEFDGLMEVLTECLPYIDELALVPNA